MFAYIVNTDLIQKKATLLTTFLLEKDTSSFFYFFTPTPQPINIAYDLKFKTDINQKKRSLDEKITYKFSLIIFTQISFISSALPASRDSKVILI